MFRNRTYVWLFAALGLAMQQFLEAVEKIISSLYYYPPP